MMIDSECNNLSRSSPFNGHKRQRLLSSNQCGGPIDPGYNVPSGSPILRKRISICMGCGQEIYDQFILRVAPDLEWHAACLKCVDCQQFLDESCTCFVRDGKTYCRRDYIRQFGVKCGSCNQLFQKNEYVMRARNKIYHVGCFRCKACSELLRPGDEFAFRDDGLFCKTDHEMITVKCVSTTMTVQPIVCTPSTATSAEATIAALCDPSGIVDSCVGSGDLELLGGDGQSSFHNATSDGRTPPLGFSLPTSLGTGGSSQQPNPSSTPAGSSSFLHQQSSSCSVSSPESFIGDERSNSGHGGHDQSNSTTGGGASTSGGVKKDKKDKPKTTRVRTVLNEKQLHTLRTCYAANPRPDALMKEQLVEMTGLSPRVIRVWFQNKRCKDKKKQILMKQLQQQQEKNQALTGIRIQGVGPLIATSPTRHDMPLVQPLDVHQYHQNSSLWVKAQATMPASMNDYHHQLHGPPLPLDHSVHSMKSHHQTPFQQLLHGFGDPHSAEAAAMGGCYLQTVAGFDGSTGQQQQQQQPSHPSCVGSGALDPDLGSLSPHLASSDLSSPSCSE